MKRGIGVFCALCALILFPLFTGCTHEKVVFDAKHPELSVSNLGISYRGKLVKPEDVPSLLEDNDFPKTSTVNIFVDDAVKDYRLAYRLMGVLVQNGYRRPILLGKEKAYSEVVDKKKKQKPSVRQIEEKQSFPDRQKKRRTIRYK